MQKLTGLLLIIIGLSMAYTGMDEERFILGMIGIGLSVAGLLVTWKAENVS